MKSYSYKDSINNNNNNNGRYAFEKDKTIKEYEDAVDKDILNFIDKVLNEKYKANLRMYCKQGTSN